MCNFVLIKEKLKPSSYELRAGIASRALYASNANLLPKGKRENTLHSKIIDKLQRNILT